MAPKRVLLWVLILLLLIAAFALPAIQLAGGVVERLANGGFEEGFETTPVGQVAKGWQWFHSGGDARYGFYADAWTPMVVDGASSQLVEISTVGSTAPERDRYAGIYQTVAVESGETYDLDLFGMLRALDGDPDRAGFSYRAEIGFDPSGGSDWQAVSQWIEIPWDTVHPRLSPGAMERFSSRVQARGPRLTVFVRLWYKWATSGRQVDLNLDAISLKGAPPRAGDRTGSTYTVVKGGSETYTVVENTTNAEAESITAAFLAPEYPMAGGRYPIKVLGTSSVGVARLELYANGHPVDSISSEVGPLALSHTFVWMPSESGRAVLKAVAQDIAGSRAIQEVAVVVGSQVQFVTNADFEGGFRLTKAGAVASGWNWFHNGRRASYGFHDDTWPPVIASGQHSQLIEISTMDRLWTDADRYAGIFQTIKGLREGATYRLSLRGMLRAHAKEDDLASYGYRVQWGFTEGSTDWQRVTNWSDVPWNDVYPRLDPGEMVEAHFDLEAPSTKITLFVRVWKKWATTGTELDLNLDDITLTGYR